MQGRSRSFFRSLFTSTYVPAGIDPVTLDENDKDYTFASDWRSIFSSFFALPNRRRSKSNRQSFNRIFKNMLGWQDKVSRWKMFFNLLLAMVVLPAYLVMAVVGTAFNIIRLVTEFVPNFIATVMTSLSNWLVYLDQRVSDKVARLKSGSFFDYVAALILQLIALPLLAVSLAMASVAFALRTLQFIGRAITSPIDNARRAWYIGHTMVGPKHQWLGNVIGLVLSGLSLTASLATYLVAVPLAMAAAWPLVLPYVPAALIYPMNLLSTYLFTPLGNIVGPLPLVMGLSLLAPAVGVSVMGLATHFLLYPLRQAYWEGKESAELAAAHNAARSGSSRVRRSDTHEEPDQRRSTRRRNGTNDASMPLRPSGRSSAAIMNALNHEHDAALSRDARSRSQSSAAGVPRLDFASLSSDAAEPRDYPISASTTPTSTPTTPNGRLVAAVFAAHASPGRTSGSSHHGSHVASGRSHGNTPKGGRL